MIEGSILKQLLTPDQEEIGHDIVLSPYVCHDNTRQLQHNSKYIDYLCSNYNSHLIASERTLRQDTICTDHGDHGAVDVG